MIGSLILTTLLLFQSAGGGQTSTNAGADAVNPPIIDNERVTVWSPAPALTDRPYDAIVISVAAGKPTIVNAYYQPAGSTEAVTGGPLEVQVGAEIVAGRALDPTVKVLGDEAAARSLRVELKQSKPPLPNATGLPDAFPRPGVFRMLDNDKFTVWDYRWTPGEPTPLHYHTKEVVVMFLENGSLVSSTTDGKATTNEHQAGEVKFNRADRTHTETLPEGTQRAVIIELK